MPSASDNAIPRGPEESRRLRALHDLQILDTGRDEEFDLLTSLAAELCDAPLAFVVLVDQERLWIKSTHGPANQGAAVPRGDAPCCLAVQSGDVLEIADVARDPRTRHMPHGSLRLYAGAVLETEAGLRIGTLCVKDTRVRQLSVRQRELLQGLARQVMRLIELRAAMRVLQHVANTDSLTGLANRRRFLQQLEDEMARFRRHGTPLALALIDLDHFKVVNDCYGHAAGDAVLVGLADLLQVSCRAEDLPARFGGEEFCVLLTHSDLDGARLWAEKFLLALLSRRWIIAAPDRAVSASIGLVAMSAHYRDPRALLAAADAAMYRAKRDGRNRVEAASG